MNKKPDLDDKQAAGADGQSKLSFMKQLESGLYYLSPREIKKLAAAADHYERTYGKEIDITKPLQLEEALFLKVSEAALAGDREALEKCIEVLDSAIARERLN